MTWLTSRHGNLNQYLSSCTPPPFCMSLEASKLIAKPLKELLGFFISPLAINVILSLRVWTALTDPHCSSCLRLQSSFKCTVCVKAPLSILFSTYFHEIGSVWNLFFPRLLSPVPADTPAKNRAEGCWRTASLFLSLFLLFHPEGNANHLLLQYFSVENSFA